MNQQLMATMATLQSHFFVLVSKTYCHKQHVGNIGPKMLIFEVFYKVKFKNFFVHSVMYGNFTATYHLIAISTSTDQGKLKRPGCRS